MSRSCTCCLESLDFHCYEESMTLHEIDLAPFIGGKARLWDFSPSHDRLVVKLIDSAGTESFLVLSGCEELTLPIFWRVTTPRISAAKPPFLEFSDSRVQVRCQEVLLQHKYARSP
jgi:hypothetical protein